MFRQKRKLSLVLVLLFKTAKFHINVAVWWEQQNLAYACPFARSKIAMSACHLLTLDMYLLRLPWQIWNQSFPNESELSPSVSLSLIRHFLLLLLYLLTRLLKHIGRQLLTFLAADQFCGVQLYPIMKCHLRI